MRWLKFIRLTVRVRFETIYENEALNGFLPHLSIIFIVEPGFLQRCLRRNFMFAAANWSAVAGKLTTQLISHIGVGRITPCIWRNGNPQTQVNVFGTGCETTTFVLKALHLNHSVKTAHKSGSRQSSPQTFFSNVRNCFFFAQFAKFPPKDSVFWMLVHQN